MIIPSKRLCDLCKNEIPEGQRYSTLTYPLERADVERLLPAPPPASLGSGFLGVVLGCAQPDTLAFEVCRGCVDGILPMLEVLKGECIERIRRDRERRRRIQEEA